MLSWSLWCVLLCSKFYSRLLRSQTTEKYIAPVVSQLCAHLPWQPQETHTWKCYDMDDFVPMALCFYKVDSHCNLFLRTLGVSAQTLMLPYLHRNIDTMQSLDLSKDAKPRNGESMTQVYLWLIPKPMLLTRMVKPKEKDSWLLVGAALTSLPKRRGGSQQMTGAGEGLFPGEPLVSLHLRVEQEVRWTGRIYQRSTKRSPR